MRLRPGLRLRSAVSEVEVVVVKAPADEVVVTCGGVPMLVEGEDAVAPTAPTAEVPDGSVDLGKRYADEARGIELLCSRAGAGTLSVDGEPLALKGAKPLPSSD
jgi:hypothetical protein